ncbi:MAG: ABC transporter permease [Planctomycetota bacterium]
MFVLETIRLGLKNLWLHKLRSLLTALGIIIGVSAVVAIAAYGEGSKQAVLREIKLLGANNIIIRSQKPDVDSPTASPEDEPADTDDVISYGLQLLDLERIENGAVEPIERLVPLKRVADTVSRRDKRVPAAAVFGTTDLLRETTSLAVARGRYLRPNDLTSLAGVAVIGAEIADRLFPLDDPLGKTITLDRQAFEVIGVLQRVGLAGGAGSSLVGRDLNFDIHIPLSTARSRFGDERQAGAGGRIERVELTELILRVPDQDDVLPVADKVRRVIEHAHRGQQDVTVIVPLELIQQAERTGLIFTMLIVIIAGLSLFVGGIGIMNIMLASVTERTREIGVRRARGATRRDIVAQFLVETTVLSGLGGLLGVGLGLAAMWVLTLLSERVDGLAAPELSELYTGIALSTAVLAGVVFGLYPAIKASQQDPIVALRHE